ncbi:MAG: cysteine desulfurase family protein [Erysipelotrichaceae bacterium]
MSYFDYAAHTPCDPEVLETYMRLVRQYHANPNALTQAGASARSAMEESCNQIAATLQLVGYEVIPTSGATEANNLALKGVAKRYQHQGKHIITTYLEHASVHASLMALQEQGFEVEFVDVQADGQIDLEHLEDLLRPDTILVSLVLVDSELGILQNLSKIQALLANHQALLHLDVTQAIGKVPLALQGVDLLAFAPHKFYGLVGCGILMRKKEVMLETQVHGGGATTSYRSGTPDLAALGACAHALQLAIEQQPQRTAIVQTWQQGLLAFFKNQPSVRINNTVHTIPHIVHLSVLDEKSETIQARLDALGIEVATKSACSAPNTISKACFAVHKNRKQALSTLRISLSHLTTQAEIEQLKTSWTAIWSK